MNNLDGVDPITLGRLGYFLLGALLGIIFVRLMRRP